MKRKLREPIKIFLYIWMLSAIAFGGLAVECSQTWAELGISILIGLTAVLPMMVLRIER